MTRRKITSFGGRPRQQEESDRGQEADENLTSKESICEQYRYCSSSGGLQQLIAPEDMLCDRLPSPDSKYEYT